MKIPAYSEHPVAYERPSAPRAALDPLRYCVMTTVALLAWLLSPPVMVSAMGAIGFWMYWQAFRGGLTRTRCVLRHPRLVLVYLAVASVAGLAGVVSMF
jgi:hypothetical protein